MLKTSPPANPHEAPVDLYQTERVKAEASFNPWEGFGDWIYSPESKWCPAPMMPALDVLAIRSSALFPEPVASLYSPSVFTPAASSERCQTPANPARVSNTGRSPTGPAASVLPQCMVMYWEG